MTTGVDYENGSIRELLIIGGLIMKLLENNWGKLRCPHCDSVMQIEEDDIREHYDDGLYVVCPVCDSIIWSNDNPVMRNIKNGITWHK